MLMRSGADAARTREILERGWDAYIPPGPRTRPGNLAWKLFEKIEQAGAESNEDITPFEAYARRHHRILAGVVSKCTRLVLPDGPAGIIVDYYCPRGGW